MKKINVFFLFRFIIGVIFLISGFEKIIQPRQNFLYVIQGYDMLPYSFLEYIAASTFPLVEFLTGVYLIAGLWTKISLFSVLACTSTFIIAVSQAIIRKLPIEECGCFGDLVGVPLWMILVMDISIFCMTVILLRHIKKTSFFSLDGYFKK